jgi:hypothetical protein
MAWTSNQLSIGVDLHKTQFTVCGLKADGEILHEGIYPCTHEGYLLRRRRIEWRFDLPLHARGLLLLQRKRPVSEGSTPARTRAMTHSLYGYMKPRRSMG